MSPLVFVSVCLCRSYYRNQSYLLSLIEISRECFSKQRTSQDGTQWNIFMTHKPQIWYKTRQKWEIHQSQIKPNQVNNKKYVAFSPPHCSLCPRRWKLPPREHDAQRSLLPSGRIFLRGGHPSMLFLLRLCRGDSNSQAVWTSLRWTSKGLWHDHGLVHLQGRSRLWISSMQQRINVRHPAT